MVFSGVWGRFAAGLAHVGLANGGHIALDHCLSPGVGDLPHIWPRNLGIRGLEERRVTDAEVFPQQLASQSLAP